MHFDQKVNKIFFDVYLVEKSVTILIRIFIDDTPLELLEIGDEVRVESLVDTLCGNGIYLLSEYYCECDKPEHNKYIYVEIEHKNNFIKWLKFYRLYEGINPKNLSKENVEQKAIQVIPAEFIFSKKWYFKEIKRLEAEFNSLQKKANFIHSQASTAIRTENIEEISRLSKSPYIRVLRCLALNKNTPTEILEYIYQKTRALSIAEEIILHPNCSLNLFQQILIELGDQIFVSNYEADKLTEQKKEIFKKQKKLFLESQWWYKSSISNNKKK